MKYLYNSTSPVSILKTLAQSYIRDTIGLYPVDDVITSGKSQIQSEIKSKIMDRMEQEDLGIQLVNLTIQDAEPPTAEVMTAFKDVENAKQGSETAVNNANKYRSEQIPAAEAQADQILQQAEPTSRAASTKPPARWPVQRHVRGVQQVPRHHQAANVLRGHGGAAAGPEGDSHRREWEQPEDVQFWQLRRVNHGKSNS